RSFGQFKIKHFHLDLSVDFEKRTLRGTETLQLKCIQDSQSELLLDIHPSLSMQEVSYCRSEDDSDLVKVEFLTRNFTTYGTTLVVNVPSPCIIEEFRLVVKYVASDGPGMSWLEPAQAGEKKEPLIESPYSSAVKVCWLESEQTAWKAKPYIFTQGQALDAELTRVWTEPCLLQAAKQEYDRVIEEFLVVGEKLFGPYIWGRYDVLFKPPLFPFGGMENPCLTFITTCILAGDRSLADVIVHEICHSWFGNLERPTLVWRQRLGGLYSDNTAKDHPLNKLHVKIKPVKATNVICIFSPPSGVYPDDTYNDTSYEKGFCFVSYLAHLAGDQSCFNAFLNAYIDRFKFHSVMAEDALEFFLEYFPDLKKKGVHKIEGLEFDSWLNVPGWPPYLPDLSAGQSLMKPTEQLSELWAVEGLDMASIKKTNIQAWKTYQTVYFLEKIIEKSPLPRETGGAVPSHHKSNNAELRLRWAQIISKNQHQPGYQHVRSLLSCQGKQMYTLLVYRALWNGSEETRALATEIFSATSHQLHVNVRNYVKKIIA
ncbi:unnamed protein product, partial [Coregonus sp. 'balchen']